MTSFIKAIRGDDASFLDLAPNANHLLNVIARRSRRTKCRLNGLDIGESFISHRSVGLTEQQYRTAKKQLKKWALVEFRIARKLTGGVTGSVTVARLLDSRVYDINAEDGNATVTPPQRQGNANLTRNKECKNVKNEKKEILSLINDGFLHWWNLYPVSRRKNKGGCLEKFRVRCKKLNEDEIIELINKISSDIDYRIKNTDDVKFIPMTEPYMNQERWLDRE